MEEDLIDFDVDKLKEAAFLLATTEENALPSLPPTEHLLVTHALGGGADKPTIYEAMNEEAKHLDADNSSVSYETYLEIDAPIPENPYRRLHFQHRALQLLPTSLSCILSRWHWTTTGLGWLRVVILVITMPGLLAV